MTIDPTREEWLEAHRKIHLRIGHITAARVIVEDVLGPCPPESPPADDRDRVTGRGTWLAAALLAVAAVVAFVVAIYRVSLLVGWPV